MSCMRFLIIGTEIENGNRGQHNRMPCPERGRPNLGPAAKRCLCTVDLGQTGFDLFGHRFGFDAAIGPA